MEDARVMEVLTDWNFWGNLREDLKDRPAYLSRLAEISGRGTATVILGVRRAGKSSLAHLLIRRMIEGGTIEAKDSLLINFEDPRFPPGMRAEHLMRMYEVYLRKLNPSGHVVLLDEVQNVEGWEKFVRYLLESRRARVLVTGSSSKLLGREVSTVLAGRHVDLEVFPLSFAEFLEFKGLRLGSEAEIMRNRLRILGELEEYMSWGGYPEVALSGSEARKRELLAGYFEDIVMKDVVRRFGVREVNKLESLANLYLSNISTLQSFNRLKEAVGLSLDTVERFTEHMETSRMFFFTRKFEFSLRRQLKSIRKVYVIDPGLFHVKGFRVSENLGKIMENLVAVELLRRLSFRGPHLGLYYWRDYQGREVDFVVGGDGRVEQLIQVSHDVGDPRVRRREIAGLLRASHETGCRNLLVLTWDQEDVEEVEGRRIRFVPLWRWLLEPPIPTTSGTP